MTMIRVLCRECGAEERLYDSEVVIYSAHFTLGMRYQCPHCLGIQTRDITLNVFGLLSQAGCRYEQYLRPAECDEWAKFVNPWTRTEILDFFLDCHGDVALAAERELCE